jgi:uncharacterized OB-fold protein
MDCTHPLYSAITGKCLQCGELVTPPQVIQEEEPPELCIYCSDKPQSPEFEPYCSGMCEMMAKHA